jgi:hypothetical protein
MQFPDLSALFAAVGVACTFTPAGGAALAEPIFVTLDARTGDALGGEQVSTRYEVRVQRADVGEAVRRGARFQIGADAYTATADFQPILDGLELSGPVKAG